MKQSRTIEAGFKTFLSGLDENSDHLVRTSCREAVEFSGLRCGFYSQTCSEHLLEVLSKLHLSVPQFSHLKNGDIYSS